jgi:two-component system C4-dicarboxylate transport sensor histidine kinase DctB
MIRLWRKHREPRIRAEGRRSVMWARALLALLVLVAVAILWMTATLLTERISETSRNRAELRLALYSGNIMSELQRHSIVPLLLARDPALIGALLDDNFSMSSQRLIAVRSELAAASLLLVDDEGRAVAATNRYLIGSSYRTSPQFVEALRARETVFTVWQRESGAYGFTYSRAVLSEGRVVGVILVEVDLAKYERSWAGFADAVAVLDSEGRVILATEKSWRGRTLAEALAAADARSAAARAITAATDWNRAEPDAVVSGRPVMQTEARMPFRGWRIVAFTEYDAVREEVNAVIALEVMAFALLLAGAFYLRSRRARIAQRALQRESAELRLLNARLQREIAQREKMQQDLAVAEQTLAQSSKLAILGEMSASISHELNQPLAAMKTYLAGARLLIQRRRSDEALASFQRIDDLIDRMAAITRQFKSYVRKGGEAFEPVDLRDCVGAALSIMEPQLKPRRVRILRNLPREPVMVMVDRLRIEQVIINLLRNALDATHESGAPEIGIRLDVAGEAVLEVRDNGHGISDLEKLFEPFWTTKKPGEGVGLGLAISSGIVSDLGGRLTARNLETGGAAFEIRLPILREGLSAAE